MDWKLVKATRQRFTGEVHASRGRLTPDRLDSIVVIRLSSRIKVERQIRGFDVRNQHPRLASSH